MTKKETLEAVGLTLVNNGHSVRVKTQGGREVIIGAATWNAMDAGLCLDYVIEQIAQESAERASFQSRQPSGWENYKEQCS